MALWGFQSEEFRADLPDPVARAAWQHAAPSIADLRIAGGKVSSAKREVALDFGGYLKGWRSTVPPPRCARPALRTP